jgi:hypothetical protein
MRAAKATIVAALGLAGGGHSGLSAFGGGGGE